MQEKQKQYEKKEKRYKDVPDKDADLDEEKPKETEQEVKVVGESLKSRSFRERMRGLSPHHLPLKDQMRNKTVSYMDLLQPGPPPSKSSKTYAKRK